jgi:GH24 family phage-related lysozyme (muramidase)
VNRKPIFDAVRKLLGRGFSQGEVQNLDTAIDRALDQSEPPAPAATLSPGPKARALIRKWEGCARKRADGRFDAYPDPGSPDGTPWTIGWGATGPGIVRGVVWTQAQCDARFDEDLGRHAREVAEALDGTPTTQGQFDALVSFHYNTGAIRRATLTQLHRQGHYERAAREFARWIYNAGKPLAGLRQRRNEEAALYLST